MSWIKIQKSLDGVVIDTIVKCYDNTNEAENDYQEFIGYYMKIAAFKAIAKEKCHYQEEPFSPSSNNRRMEYVAQNEFKVFRVVITLGKE